MPHHWLIGHNKQYVPQAPYFVDAQQPADVEDERGRPRVRAPGTRSFGDLGALAEREEDEYRKSLPPRTSSKTPRSVLPYRRSQEVSSPPPVPAVPSQYQSPRSSTESHVAMPGAPKMTSSQLSPTPSRAPSPAGSAVTRADSPTMPGAPPSHGHPDMPGVPKDAFFDPMLNLRPRFRPRVLATTPSVSMAPSSLPEPQSTVPVTQESVPAASSPPAEDSTPVATSAPSPVPTTVPLDAPEPAPATTGRGLGTAPSFSKSTTFRYPPSAPPQLTQFLMPQPPSGPQCQLFGFRYHSEPIEGEEDSWLIEMRYQVRILPDAQTVTPTMVKFPAAGSSRRS